jgi:hypothetical protein
MLEKLICLIASLHRPSGNLIADCGLSEQLNNLGYSMEKLKRHEPEHRQEVHCGRNRRHADELNEFADALASLV